MIFGKFINKYYKKYAAYFIIGILFAIFVDWLQLYIPEFTGKIVNILSAPGGITDSGIQEISRMCIWIILVGIGMFVGRIGWRFGILTAGIHIETDLRHEMFCKAEKLSVTYYHDNKVGNIMAWFTNDLEVIQDSLGFGIVMTVDAVFLLGLTLFKMIASSPVLTIISSIPIVLIILWGGLVEKYMTIKWDARQKANDELYDYSQESFTGIRVIKAFVKENQDIHAFSKVARKNVDVDISFVRVSVLFDVCIEVIIALVFSILLGFGGWFVWAAVTGNNVVVFGLSTTLTVGGLIEFTGYFDTLIWPLIALGQVVTMHAKAKASMGRIVKFIEAPEDICDKEDAVDLNNCQGKITFKNFNFKYPGSELPSLVDVDLTIEPGECVGIVGKIGTGKSTLVNSLVRLYNVDAGSIFIDDIDLMSIKVKSLRDNISIVPQDNFLFGDTIESNINFSNDDSYIESAISAAKFAAVDDNIEAFNSGYQTITGERGTSLSGGQKQRISIARAYAKNAPIMILDDSVSAVDVKTEETIINNIHKYRKGKTTLVIASRVSTVSKMDKIIVLDEGRVEAFDTPERLQKISPLYQKMVFLQQLEREVEGKEGK